MPRILVVDDDVLVTSAIRTHLEACGYQVSIAESGISGLRALDEVTFDLMIVDIFMPHMRGFESIRVFHQHAPTVPFELHARRSQASSSPITSCQTETLNI
jgi:CheY-like chemotaxis protein